MASNYVVERNRQSLHTHAITFAGDGVRLSGQIDYPRASNNTNSKGNVPLVFVLPHAGCNTRDTFTHYARTALSNGYAVFRWDKRGTGRSGAGGRGSAMQDAVLAYETALDQPRVDTNKVVILAQSDATTMLGKSFGLYARLAHPAGVILAGNMLDDKEVLAIQAPTLIISGENDWTDWHMYVKAAVAAHNAAYDHGASGFVADGADRTLMTEDGGHRSIHFAAQRVMGDWLATL